ncbi:hypothetical protein ACH5RR_014662 [Cinchona calisaya]|uniref:BAH domain-containing protein n=1 Tax=Cinchona calisaya TaxID=153742 RepID=A0ABD2ZS42_9GENT
MVKMADNSRSFYNVCMILGFVCMLLLLFGKTFHGVVDSYNASESANEAGIEEPAFSKENKATTARKLLALSGNGTDDGVDGGDGGDGGSTNRIGQSLCSKDNIFINQGQTSPLPSGIPTYTVEVQNVCISGSCSISDIHLSCGWFSSARLINPQIFRRIAYDDCLVNDGQALNPGEALTFQMFLHNQVFITWEERIISQEKGNRDFVDAYGYMGTVTAGTKWRARREVVEWLTELVSEFRQSAAFSRAEYLTIESTLHWGSPGFSMDSLQNLTNQMDQIQVSRKFKAPGSDIVWSGEAWLCSKELKHYPAFCRNKTIIAVYSFVLIMAEEESHCLGYVEDLYEDKKGEKLVQVRLFHHNQEIKHIVPELNVRPEEVFITSDVQRISAKNIDSVVTVLTPNHYKKCLALLPEKSSSGIYMCHREFKKNKIKPFSVSKLRGYNNQAILSSFVRHHGSRNRAKVRKTAEEGNDFHSVEPSRQRVRRTRSRTRNQKQETAYSGVTNLIPEKQVEKCEPTHRKLKIKLSIQGPAAVKLVGFKTSQASSEDDGENIELLCQDSGIRGCWFRCKILQTSQKGIKVQYYDVQDVDGPGKLEEWIPAPRVAAPDKLGMRFAGRLTVRPWPHHDSSNCSFEVGDSVDAWWCDGWWEGVIIGLDINGSDNLQVYFPGENKFLTLQRKDLRPSRDWVGNKWMEINPKRDILSVISSTVSHNMKLPMCSTSAEVSKHHSSRLAESQVPVSSKLKASEDGNQKLHCSASSADLKDVDGLNSKKRLRIRHADNIVDKDKGPESNARGSSKSVSKDIFGNRHKIVKK